MCTILLLLLLRLLLGVLCGVHAVMAVVSKVEPRNRRELELGEGRVSVCDALKVWGETSVAVQRFSLAGSVGEFSHVLLLLWLVLCPAKESE